MTLTLIVKGLEIHNEESESKRFLPWEAITIKVEPPAFGERKTKNKCKWKCKLTGGRTMWLKIFARTMFLRKLKLSLPNNKCKWKCKLTSGRTIWLENIRTHDVSTKLSLPQKFMRNELLLGLPSTYYKRINDKLPIGLTSTESPA